MTTFPSWRTGPNGERRIFQKAEDVPDGWVDGLHPSVRIVLRIHEDGRREMIKQMEIDAVRGDEEAELSIVSASVDPDPAPRMKRRYTRRQP